MSAANETSRPAARQVADALASECLALRARLLSRAITGIYDAALRPLGLRAGQMSILAVLVKEGPLTASRLGEMLVIEKSTLSRNIQRMGQQEWIRAEVGADGRERLLSITARGRQLLGRVYPHWQTAQRDAAKLLGTEGAAALRDVANTAWESTRSE